MWLANSLFFFWYVSYVSYALESFLGHTFFVRDSISGSLVDYTVMDGLAYDFHPANRLETCEDLQGGRRDCYCGCGCVWLYVAVCVCLCIVCFGLT